MQKRGRIGLALLCCVLLFLCGCDFPLAQTEESESSASASQTPNPLPSASEPAPDIVMSISRDADKTLTEAAEYFCAEYERITGGKAELTRAIAPDADLLAGRAQLALLNKKRQLEFNAPLAATATPFLYNDYNSFTMRINASSTLSLLDAALRAQVGLVPLSAYYQGSKHLMANFQISGYQPFELIYFGISDDSDMRTTAERLLSVPVVADTDAERMALYYAQEADVIEVSLEEIAGQDGFEWPTYVVSGYHNVVPVWMLARAEFYDGLSPVCQAEIAEILAHMTDMIDSAYLEAEDKAMTGLAQVENLIVSTELSIVRNRVFNTLPVPDSTASAQRRLARDLINMMRRIA